MPSNARSTSDAARRGEAGLAVVAVVGLLVLPLLLLTTGLALRRQFEREHVLRAEIQGAYDYRTLLRSVLIDLQDAETGQRGFLLTGRPSYLVPYSRARGRVADDLRSLSRPGQARNAEAVARLSGVARAKFEELAATVRLKQEGRDGEALAIVRTDLGQHEMDAARALVAAERDRTSKVVAVWNRLADDSAATMERAALLVAGLILSALAASASLVAYVLVQRRRAVAVLAAAHARVAELLGTAVVAERTSKSGHWSLSCDAGDHAWSDGMFPIFGLPVDGRPPDVDAIIDMFAEQDRTGVRARLAHTFRTHEGFEFESELRDARGALKYVRVRAEHISEGPGGRLVGAVQDITAERQAQLALSESEKRYRHLAESGTDIMATLSTDCVLQYVSPACGRILGYEPAELVGRGLLALIHTEDTPAVLAVFEGLRRAGPGEATVAHRFRARHKDGAWVWLEGQPRVEFDASGAATRYQDVLREVGSRKAAEEALEASRAMALQSERRYRLLAENAIDMIARYGLDGEVTYVSPACRKMLGYDASELVGRSNLGLVHPDDLPRMRAQSAAHRASRSREAAHTEYRVTRRDGEVIWLEGRPKLVFDETGDPVEYQDVVRDITARKAMDAQLHEARGAAEAAARSKADFLANMSHELRTPLNSIVGFAGLIVEAPELLAGTRHRAGIVRDSSRALVEIVDDILDFSKFEAEGVTLSPEPTELPDLLESTVELMRQQADAKGVRLSLGEVADPGAVLVDPARLRQVIINLVGNAIKFTEAGTVTLALAEDADGRLRLSVHDTGVGIARDRLDHVFTRFVQADASTSRRFGGTGLGLAICSAIVDAMGGEIGVESEEGVGSTFWCALDPPRAARPPAASPAPEPPACGSSALSGLRVLVADDNVFNQELFEALMAGRGLEITCAADGREAVELARAAPFDLVLMDMQMPVMDGLEATRAIRDLGLTRLPVVALTANVVRSQIALCLAAGMNDHLAKPYTAEAALAMIAKWTVERPPSAADRADRAACGAA